MVWLVSTFTTPLDPIISLKIVQFCCLVHFLRWAKTRWRKENYLPVSQGQDDLLPKKTSQQIEFINNCRFWLETFVIFKHQMSLLPWGGDAPFSFVGLGRWVESFHMNMFCIVSGNLSRGDISQDRATSAFVRVAMPLFLDTALRQLNSCAFGGWIGCPAHGVPDLLSHAYVWFLCVWLLWRAFNPFIVWLKPVPMYAAAWLFCLTGGYLAMYVEDNVFHFKTFIGYIPYFALGYLMPRELPDFAKTTTCKHIGCAIALGSMIPFLVMAYYSTEEPVKLSCPGISTDSTLNQLAFDIQSRYHHMDYLYSKNRDQHAGGCYLPPLHFAWLLRVGVFLLALLVGFSVLVMVPHDKQIYSEWGSNTLYAYLLQTEFFHFIKSVSRHWLGVPLPNLENASWTSQFGWLAILFATALGINAMLCCKVARSFFKPFIEPTWVLYLQKSRDA